MRMTIRITNQVFKITDIPAGYIRNSNYPGIISIRLNPYIFNKSLYPRALFEFIRRSMEAKASLNSEGSLKDKLERIDDTSLYSKAWCNK